MIGRRGAVAKPAPTRRMFKALTAAVTAISLLAASVAPAHADRRSDDFAKALAAIAALALIGSAISNNNNHTQPRPPVYVPPRPQPPVYHHPVQRPRVPNVCAIQIEGRKRHSTTTVFTESCLRAEGFRYALPRNCARDIRIYGRNDRVYSENCLEGAGFRVDGRW
jgi:hypothetical protein